MELANRDSASSWSTFISQLKERGLHGVQMVISDAHDGLQHAISRLLPAALWQRCYVHFLRNALDYLPRKHTDEVMTELRWLYDRQSGEEARKDLRSWLVRWEESYPKLCEWVEGAIEQTFSFYQLPRQHHKHLKSTNLLERLNQELKRRTHIVRIFPNPESCLRLVRALAVEIHEHWLEGHRYLDMSLLNEQRVMPPSTPRGVAASPPPVDSTPGPFKGKGTTACHPTRQVKTHDPQKPICRT